MLLQLLRFELRYQARQRALPVAAFVFFTLGWFLGNAGNAPAMVDFNAPFQISYYTGNLSLMTVFIIMFFAVSGAIRDRRYQMEPIIHSSSVRKVHFFWSKFIGVFLFSVLGFSLFLPGFLVGLSLSDLDAARIGPFQLRSYLWPLLVIIVPNVFICTSLLFSVSLLSKSNVAVYASAVLIYILYFVVGILSNSPMFASSLPASPERMALAALADPFAISTFFEHTHFWTPFEKSNEPFSFSGNYRRNRLLWTGFSFLLLGITYRLFSFRKMGPLRKKKPETLGDQMAIGQYRPVSIRINTKTQWMAWWSSVVIDVKEILKSLPFMAILFTLLIAMLLELYIKFFEGGSHGESWYPFTNLVIETVVEIIPILIKILIVFYSGELIWKASERKFDGILNACPTLNWVFFSSKLTVLVLLPALLIATAILVCLMFQAINGFTNLDHRQYLLLFYHHGIPALVFSMLAIFVQSISRSKYLGMGITGLIILCLATPLSNNLGIEHPMLRIGVMPSIPYSNLAGYGIQSQAFAIYAWYWTAFGITLSILSLKCWNRRLVEPWRIRNAMDPSKWKRREIMALSLSLLIFMATGMIVYGKIHHDGNYRNKQDKMDYSEQYERKFKQFEGLPSLHYTALETEVAIYPHEEKYTVSADYQLINKNDVPVKRVFLTETKKLSDIRLENATLIFKDTAFGTYLFEFNSPLLPQQTTSMRYQLSQQSLPFRPDPAIVKNGTHIRREVFEPALGYQKSLELADARERKKRGLPRRNTSPVNDQYLLNAKAGNGDVAFETIVSTSEDQIALAPGNLIKKWTENGRNFYQYQYPEKNVPVIVYSSAKYEVQEQSCYGVDVTYYYHPGHDINHETIAASTCATMSYCIENFGDYPFDHLRISEIPSYYPFGGTAHPGLIHLVEDDLYLLDIRQNSTYNPVANRTAKEIAHQWWGMALTPKSVPGMGFFTQGLTKYTAAIILQKMYGIGAQWELCKNLNERYFRGRSFAAAAEPPLYLEEGEYYLTDGKSSLVLLAIRDLIGEEKLNSVLRNLIERDTQAATYEVHTLNFMEELYQAAPRKYHPLIDEWMKQIIRYELTIDHTDHRRLANGSYEITATITANRFKTLSSGKEVAIGIDEPLKIGCFAQHPKDLGTTDQVVYLKDHRINAPRTNIRLVLDTLPQFISIDPFLTRMDRNYADNLKAIREK